MILKFKMGSTNDFLGFVDVVIGMQLANRPTLMILAENCFDAERKHEPHRKY